METRFIFTLNETLQSTNSPQAADTLFNGLSKDSTIEILMNNSDWSSYIAMFIDKYGVEWMIDFDTKHKGEQL